MPSDRGVVMDFQISLTLVNRGVDICLGVRPDKIGNFINGINSAKGFQVINTLEINTDLLLLKSCLLYTSPSPRDKRQSRMPSSA